MKQNTFNQVVGALFAVGALVHLWRLLTGTQARLGNLELPVWVSVIGVLVAGYLAYSAYKLTK